jgi:hypothetical protein
MYRNWRKVNMKEEKFVFEVHQPQVDFSTYRFYVRGTPKIGKTTLFRDVVEYLYNDPMKGLLISLGSEIGYKTLKNIVAKHCMTWYDFENLVEYLVENKDKNSFQIIGIDTVDRLMELVERRVMDIHRSIKGEYPISIDGALGGFTKGKNKAKTLVEQQISKLENAGYGVFYIGHTKEKQMGDIGGENQYEKITGSMEFKYDGIFSDRADFTIMIVGESVVKDKKQSELKRYIYFRATPSIDAGSRLSDEYLPVRTEYSAENLVKTIVNALESSAGVSGDEAEKIREKEVLEREKTALENIDAIKKEKYPDMSLKDYQEQVLEYAKSLSEEVRLVKKEELNRKGLPTRFKEIGDIETLKKVRAILAGEN